MYRGLAQCASGETDRQAGVAVRVDAKTRASADAKLIVKLRQGYGVAQVHGADLDFSRRPYACGKIYRGTQNQNATSELTLEINYPTVMLSDYRWAIDICLSANRSRLGYWSGSGSGSSMAPGLIAGMSSRSRRTVRGSLQSEQTQLQKVKVDNFQILDSKSAADSGCSRWHAAR